MTELNEPTLNHGDTDILKAIIFATQMHNGQLRKYTGKPYISHPIAVAAKIVNHGLPKAAIIAAILHDTVEDTLATHELVLSSFGQEVSDIVKELTDVDKDDLFEMPDGTKKKMNRAARKKMDAERLAKASNHAHSIKLADLIDNTSSIVKYDPDFAVKYLSEKAEILKVLTRGHPDLMAEAAETYAAALVELNIGSSGRE